MEFDYIVIGAGAAGCVLANRLSADRHNTVLLLEAGGRDRNPLVTIPAAFGKLFGSRYDWAHSTEPQQHLFNRNLYWPRGKVLGGSTSMHAMIYMRGHRKCYDNWQMLGNDAWGFDSLLPFFKKSENQQRGISEYHDTGGPLDVSDLVYRNPISSAFVRAGVEFGLVETDD